MSLKGVQAQRINELLDSIRVPLRLTRAGFNDIEGAFGKSKRLSFDAFNFLVFSPVPSSERIKPCFHDWLEIVGVPRWVLHRSLCDALRE